MKNKLASVFNFAVKTRKTLYEHGLFETIEFPVPVVSVGNISMGGTGKSALTCEIARWLVEAKRKPALLTRGYGRKSKKAIFVSANTVGTNLPSADELGDEPYMIKIKVPEISLIVHARRGVVAKKFWKQLKCDFIIMDDAFQHWQVKRDMDIVTVDATEDLNQGVIPYGRLREPATALSRADIIIISHANEVSKNELLSMKTQIDEITQGLWPAPAASWRRSKKQFPVCPHRPLFYSSYESEGIFSAKSKNPIKIKKNQKVFLLMGIAKPDSFRRVVRSLSINVIDELVFSDHHHLSKNEIKKIDKLSKKYSESEVLFLTTEKDFYRWRNTLSIVKLHYLRVKFSVSDPFDSTSDNSSCEELKQMILKLRV